MKQAQPETFSSAISTTPTPNRSEPNWLAQLGLSRFVAVDVETTGLTPASDKIIEVGAVLFVDGRVADSFQSFLDPGQPIPYFITSLTGITNQDVKGAPRFDDIRADLLDFIGDAPIVGQNTSFDLGFLSANGGNDFRFPGRMVLDTAELARIFWAEFPRFSLGSLCRTFDVELSTAHRANDDAQATGEVLATIVSRLPNRVWGTLATELYEIAAQGHHRAELFFAGLRSLAKDSAAPEFLKDLDRPELERISLSALDKGGEFERELTRFAPRSQQLKMATLVQTAFSDRQTLILEAPTGTGKSLGYLVPALEWAFGGDDSDRQVVISSHTRSLQEQLMHKDVRDIATATNASVPAAVLKGRDNYLCKRRLRSALLDLDGRLSDGDRHRLLPLVRWSHLTQTGDIGEIGGFRPEFEPHLWSMVCSDGAACSGSMCGANRGDFFRQALDESKKAKLLLVNHALLATDFTRFVGGEGVERRLVIDEAHKFERAVVSAYTAVFSARIVRNVLSRLSDERTSRGLLVRLAKDFKDDKIGAELAALDVLTKALFQQTRLSFQEAAGLPSQTLPDESRQRLRADTPEQVAIESALQPLLSESAELSLRMDKLLSVLAHEDELPRDARERVLELRSAQAALTEAIEAGQLTVKCSDPDFVYWWESSSRRSNPTLTLLASPISIAEPLERELWGNVKGAVLSSATLAHRGEFSNLKAALGIQPTQERSVECAVLDSPFDLPMQMRCFCPTYLPDAKQVTMHLEGIAEFLSKLMESVPRSVLVLCTSHASSDELIKQLTPVARVHNRQLFQQRGGRDTHEIVKAFRESSGAMLIGSSALWEGIDLIGEALEILVVVKLPFDVPTEPWHEARGELAQSRNEDPFYSLSIPACATRLRQGIGRLIRHYDDRGVAVIADSRLVSTRYGKVLQQSLPVPVVRAESLEVMMSDIRKFFESRQ